MYIKLDEGFLDFFSNTTPPVQAGSSTVNKPSKPRSTPTKKSKTNPYYQYTKNLFDLISKEATQDGWKVSSTKIENQTPNEFTNSLVLKKEDRTISIILPFKDSKFEYYLYDSYETSGDVSPTTTSFKDLSTLRTTLTNKLNPTTEKYQPDYQYFSKKFNELSTALEDNGWKIEKNQIQRLNTDKAFDNQLSVSKNNKTLAYRVTISKDKIINKTNKNYTVGIVNELNTQKRFNNENQADDYFDKLSSQIDNISSSKQPQKYRTIKELLIQRKHNATTSNR